MRLIDVLTSPWAIVPEKLLEIRSIYETHLRGEKIDLAAIEARIGQPLAREEQNYQLAGNVGIVTVDGVLSRKANLFTKVSGGASTQLIGRDLQMAMQDPAAESILLHISSPGGAVAGIQELAQIVSAAAAQKPLIVLAQDVMASGAYWFGSAADQIFASAETDQIGSIGVVATHQDISRAEEAAGIKTTEITAGKYKRISSSYAPLSEEGRAALQEQVDALYTIFVNDVAKHRGVDAERVLTDMADGRVFLARDAINRGLIDGMASFDQLVADMSAGRMQSKRRVSVSGVGTSAAVSHQSDQEVNTMDIKTLREKHPDVASALIDEGRQAGVQEGISQGAAAERQRIKDVEAQTLPGHEALIATLKYDGKTSGAEAAVQVLNAERSKRDAALGALRSEAPAPVPPTVAPAAPAAPPAESTDVETRAKAAWDKDPKVRDEFGSFDTYLAYERANVRGAVRVLHGKAA